ncbi:hypothetical protein KQ304_13435 [Synechococcus sp. CS-1329]|jgi:hypothetical protein|uniref:hypothetical protein n=1 Tax=Synechococcus sp. CS-1329 TaxID=2847975 RepID=UPI00223A940E|nr:hypothetical protein [Synechococcus sp. CS-1329]MCT0219980.1 hypothetical protein [Synechococcus sp. CS-1329]
MGPLTKSTTRTGQARWLPWWLCCLVAAAPALVGVAPAHSGSVTADSVWTRENALQRARQLVPSGAIPGRHRCQEMTVGMGNFRYRCTVEFSRPAAVLQPDQQPAQQPDQQPDQPSP